MNFSHSFLKGHIPLSFLILSTLGCILVSVFFIQNEYVTVFQNIYYIPIVLACVLYGRRGFLFSCILAIIYFGLLVGFTLDYTILFQACIRVAFFVSIAGIITFLVADNKRYDNTLQHLTQFQNGVISNAQVLMTVLDQKGNILLWNTAAEDISGYRSDEVIGKNEIWKLLYPEKEYRKQVTDVITRIIQEKNFLENFKTTIRSKGGNERIISWNTKGIPDEMGKISTFIAIGVDVTDKQLAEQKQKESEKRYRYALETGEFGAWKLDLVTGILTRSHIFDRIFGYENPLSEWTYDTFLALVVPEDRTDVEERIKATIRTLQKWDFKCQITRSDGEIRWIWVRGTPELNDQKEPMNMFGLIQDITEQKHEEEELQILYTDLEIRVKERTLELQESNQILQDEVVQRKIAEETYLQTLSILNATIESTEDGLFVIDNAGTSIKYNNQFIKMWNISESINPVEEKVDYLGSIISQVKNPDPFIDQIHNKYNQAKDIPNFEIIELMDGHIYEWYSRPQKVKDEVVGKVWSFRDVTIRKKLELQVEKSLKEKEMLLKEIHHRVKNNMQVISSLLFIQERKIKDEQVKEILRESQNRIKSIALVHEKLYQSTDFERIDYNDYLRKIIHHLFESYQVDTNRITLNLNSETIFLPIDKAVPCSLIVNELISNSIKYAFPDQRKGIISINFQRNSDFYVLIFSDDGVGIVEGIDVEHTDTLGLELIKGLVCQLSGTIDLDRTYGTAYTIRFPV